MIVSGRSGSTPNTRLTSRSSLKFRIWADLNRMREPPPIDERQSHRPTSFAGAKALRALRTSPRFAALHSSQLSCELVRYGVLPQASPRAPSGIRETALRLARTAGSPFQGLAAAEPA